MQANIATTHRTISNHTALAGSGINFIYGWKSEAVSHLYLFLKTDTWLLIILSGSSPKASAKLIGTFLWTASRESTRPTNAWALSNPTGDLSQPLNSLSKRLHMAHAIIIWLSVR